MSFLKNENKIEDINSKYIESINSSIDVLNKISKSIPESEQPDNNILQKDIQETTPDLESHAQNVKNILAPTPTRFQVAMFNALAIGTGIFFIVMPFSLSLNYFMTSFESHNVVTFNEMDYILVSFFVISAAFGVLLFSRAFSDISVKAKRIEIMRRRGEDNSKRVILITCSFLADIYFVWAIIGQLLKL